MPLLCFNSSTAMQSTEGPPVEHVTVYGSASGSVRSASPNVQTTLASPMMTVQQTQTQTQTQATAFVQPTQQQSVTHTEPADLVIEATPSSQVEWPSTSSTSSVFGTGEQKLSTKCFWQLQRFGSIYYLPQIVWFLKILRGLIKSDSAVRYVSSTRCS